MRFTADISPLLGLPGFRRLLATRLVSQFSDGLFQVAIAAAVVFSPEKAPDARSIAAAFATMLLPYSVLGPFVGVFLDRWPRRSIMLWGNVCRCLLILLAAAAWFHDIGPGFFVAVLTAFSVNRFVLAGLSAALPHVVPVEGLVSANALTPTCGTLAYVCGLGAGSFLRAETSDLVVMLSAAAGFLLAGLTALRLPFLGPDSDFASRQVRAAVGHVVSGLADALRHLTPRVRVALLTVVAVRVPFGMMTTATILHSRHVGGPGAKGLAGLGLAAAASAAAFAVAMVLVPSLVNRVSIASTVTLLLLVGGLVVAFPGPLFTPWAIAVAAFGVGLATQGVKICTDSLLQAMVDDVFLGRVFALYDVAFNVALVVAVFVAAFVLPPDGMSVAVMAATSLWYAAAAIWWTLAWRRTGQGELNGQGHRSSSPATEGHQ